MPKNNNKRELCHIFIDKSIFSVSDIIGLIDSVIGKFMAVIRLDYLYILKNEGLSFEKIAKKIGQLHKIFPFYSIKPNAKSS
jgi:hypothetical protein